jgi:hypothetical protein
MRKAITGFPVVQSAMHACKQAGDEKRHAEEEARKVDPAPEKVAETPATAVPDIAVSDADGEEETDKPESKEKKSFLGRKKEKEKEG